MSRKRFSVEQIINHLQEAEVLLAQGKTVGEICRQVGVSEHRYYPWRRHYNTLRPHSALGYRPPAPGTILSHAADLPGASGLRRADWQRGAGKPPTSIG